MRRGPFCVWGGETQAAGERVGTDGPGGRRKRKAEKEERPAGKPRGEGRRQGGRGGRASGGTRPQRPAYGTNAGQGCGNAENSCAGDGAAGVCGQRSQASTFHGRRRRCFLRAPHSPFAEGAQWPKQTKVEGKVCAGRKSSGARMRAKQPRPQGRGCPNRSKVYLKTPNVTGSEGGALRKALFRRNTAVFQGKMAQRSVKRPAVRVRWALEEYTLMSLAGCAACGCEKGPDHVRRWAAVFL